MTKISQLPVDTSPTSDDYVPSLDNASSTLKRSTWANVAAMFAGLTQTFTNKTITDPSNSVSSKVLTNPYKFSAYSNSAQTPSAGVWTLVNIDTKLFDTGTSFNTATHLFTAPIAGFYQFNAGVGFNSAPDNQLLAVGLIKNATSGTPNYQGPTIGNASGANNVASLDFSRTLQLNANDTIGLMAYSASGLGIVSGNAPMYTVLECFFVSAT